MREAKDKFIVWAQETGKMSGSLEGGRVEI